MAGEASSAVAEAGPVAPGSDGFARGARILSIGIASTGIFTFAYFATASHVLDRRHYGAVSLLWAVLFVVISISYRPVEQLLSRTIAARRGAGMVGGHPLRTPATLQITFATIVLVVALSLRPEIEKAFAGSAALFWILVVAAVAYAASYFARGWFAGHQWFGLYGGLVFFESVSRFSFAFAVAIGLAHGTTAVALGIAAAPVASLAVLPWALGRGEGSEGARDELSMREGGGFALSVAGVQMAEQALLNAAVVIAAINVNSGSAGVVFSALLITRAPLQLFQSIQTSLLPHLASGGDVGNAIRTTIKAIWAFALTVALALVLVGPRAMDVIFGPGHHYERFGLAALAIGMGFHLTAGTLNQVALARHQAGTAAVAWLACAAGFLLWMILAPINDQVLLTEVGYLGATMVLAALLAAIYLTHPATSEAARAADAYS